MQKKFGIFFPWIISLLLHLVVIFSCSFQIKAKGDPFFQGWSNIVSREDLFLEEKEVIFPKSVNFSSGNTRRRYLFFLPHYRLYSLESRKDYNLDSILPKITKALVPSKKRGKKESYFYLWERRAIFSPWEEETISYKAYVSPYGKVLFLYPEKLPFNSYGNLRLQEYLRKAAFFLDDRFFWTKLEGIVE